MIEAWKSLSTAHSVYLFMNGLVRTQCNRRNNLLFCFVSFQGFVPGMFGVSHGALQFMTYEEMKNKYNEYRNVPIDTKMVSRAHCLCTINMQRQQLKSLQFHFSFFAGNQRIFSICGSIEIDSGRCHLSISSITGTSTRSTPYVCGHMGLHQANLEV